MKRWAAAAAAVLCAAAPAFSALSYSSFAHPKGEFAFEYPSNWHKSLGLEMLALRPPGRDGKTVRVTVASYPFGKDSPPTPAAYVAKLLVDAQGLKKLERRDKVKTAAGDAERLELLETKTLRGQFGTTLPGPMRQLYVVVPRGAGYLVLALEGVGDGFTRARAEFDHLVATLKLDATPPAAR
jgi:hypothetical protein